MRRICNKKSKLVTKISARAGPGWERLSNLIENRVGIIELKKT